MESAQRHQHRPAILLAGLVLNAAMGWWWADPVVALANEILGGTDCSESWSLGSLLQGRLWGRPHDNLGLGGVIGGLSPVARAYFAAGGLGILIGDGRLDYRAEKALEAYYSYALRNWATLSVDYQFVVNPGYDTARGPAPIYAVRVHTAF